MSRTFCVPAVFFIFSAFVLLFIVSISLPYLTDMDITRMHTPGTVPLGGDVQPLSQLRLGIWYVAPLIHSWFVTYLYAGLTATLPLTETWSAPQPVMAIQSRSKIAPITRIHIDSSWTLGLAVHPVACGVSFVALLFSFSQHITVTLLASLISFLAATLTTIAFAIDIALYAYFKNQMGNLGYGSNTITGPGFWLTFASVILLILGGLTVCCGRRRGRMSSATRVPHPRPNSSPDSAETEAFEADWLIRRDGCNMFFFSIHGALVP
ncbi:hypothetical protein JVU11DRAFT_9016 [Chiua virens]|nr:hypothetical protein JVU11DRAFT_9016 [Chiua virens]